MYIKIKVVADSRNEKVEQKKEDEYHIWVKEKAEQNMANRRILEILGEIFSGKDIRIISGHHSPSKIISIN